jgi:hypothetical protein
MEIIDILMVFVLPALMGIIGIFGILSYVKKYSPKENEKNTTLLLNIAHDDEIGFIMLGYIFSWVNAVLGCGIFILTFTLYLFGIIEHI